MHEQTCGYELKFTHPKINVKTLDKSFIFIALTFSLLNGEMISVSTYIKELLSIM